MAAAEKLDAQYPSARIAYVFEAGTRGSGEIQKTFDWNYTDREQRPKLKLLSLKFEGKEFAPLQAADILAYELYRYFPRTVSPPPSSEVARDEIKVLAECPLKSWARLEDSEIFKWATIVEAAVVHHGYRRKPNRSMESRLKT
jgi:hypothetical protein